MLSAQPLLAQSSNIAAFVSASFESRHLPGAAVIVIDREQTRFFGVGEDANGQAISIGTRFYIGSLSKAFTAAAVLQLVERGQVDLDVPVRRYLPEFHPADPRAERITPRHLLNQTSGMSIAGDREWQRPQPRSLKEAVARLGRLRLTSDPGTRFSYHNPNYSVLASLVEVLSGADFAAYLRANIFLPLLLLAAIILAGVPLTVSQVLSWSWIWLWYYVPVWTTFLLSCAAASLLVAGARLISHIRISFLGDRDGAHPQ